MYERSSSGLGTNGNVNIPLMPLTMKALRPGLTPVGWQPSPFEEEDSGITLGPGESVPPEEGDVPLPEEPTVAMPEPRPPWVIPAVVLGGLAVVGGGIWWFMRSR
jgi:hypothetical protein